MPDWTRRFILLFFAHRFLVGALGVIQDDGGRVLFVRQTYRGQRPWGLPGGWIKSAETLEQGLAREVAEETGLSVRVGPVATVKHGPYGEIIVAYYCDVLGGSLQPDPVEIAEVRFFAEHELPEAEPFFLEIVASRHQPRYAPTAILTASHLGESSVEGTVSTSIERYRDVCQKLRLELQGLDPEALHWAPGPETNTIAVLVTHMLGSALDTLRRIRGIQSERVRASEFVRRDETADDLLRRVDAADAQFQELGDGLTEEQLRSPSTHGTRGTQSGWFWLVDNYGHLREHLAHVQLTRQLYGQHRAAR